jgi:hypothetical protein
MTLFNNQERELEALFDAAQKSCRAGTSTDEWEPELVALLEFIEQHPDCLPHAEKLFIEGLARPNDSLCYEIVSFCMHSLRMPTVKEAASRLISQSDPRGWGPLSDIIASFEDSWDDADLYEYYGTQSSRRRKDMLIR